MGAVKISQRLIDVLDDLIASEPRKINHNGTVYYEITSEFDEFWNVLRNGKKTNLDERHWLSVLERGYSILNKCAKAMSYDGLPEEVSQYVCSIQEKVKGTVDWIRTKKAVTPNQFTAICNWEYGLNTRLYKLNIKDLDVAKREKIEEIKIRLQISPNEEWSSCDIELLLSEIDRLRRGR